MKKSKFWKNKLKFFIVPHPKFEQTDEEIFTPIKGLKIRFWIEGNLQVEGIYENLQINYNSIDCLVLSLNDSESNQANTFRIPWKRIILFELVTNENTDEELLKLISFNPNQNN